MIAKSTEPSVNGTKKTTTVKTMDGGELLQEIVEDGDKVTNTSKNLDGNGFTQIIKEGENSTTGNQLNNEGHRISSTKVVDGKEYTLNYDGQGNTTGIIVQNGESPASIAKKFGCTEAQLREANKDVLGGKKYFDVGSEIKVPRELEADDKALQGRKSSQEAKAEFARDEQIRAQKRAEAQARQAEAAAKKAEAKARDKALREDLGLTNYKGAGEKVQGDFYTKGKKTSSRTFTKIGNATHGRTICQDKSGKIYVVAHNGVVLKETWVNVSAHRDVQVVGNRRVAVEKGARDGHGRKTVYDGDGNAHVMSHDNKILKKEYVAKSDKSDAIRKDSKTAQQATVDMLDAQLAAAKENFNEQMKQDGWAGDFADGVSKIWNNDLFGGGTGNTADQVRQDFKTYQNNINQLKAAAKQGDGAFKAKFKQIYGVDYNQKSIADYNMNPTEANYRKAFGTKNNIGERVAKYNASQQLGSTVVKTGVEMTVAGTAIAAADALEVVTFGASTPVSMAITGAATFASDVLVEGSDRVNITGEYRDADGNIVKTDGAFKEGTDAGAILEDASKDALIAGATLGVGKFANSAYKVGKAAYATSKVAGKAATVGEKAVATVAKAETGVARTTTTVAKAETGVARTTTTVAKSETGVAKVETGVAKAETTATKAEDAAAKAGEAAQEAAGAGAKTSHIAEKVIDTTADVAVGATAEYIETGDVTLEGTAMNAAVGSIGIAGEKLGGKLKSSAKFQQVKEGVSDAYHNAKGKVSDGVSGAYQKAKDGVSGAYNSAKEKVSGAADNMKEKFSQRKANNTEGAGSSQKAEGQARPMSEAEINERISNLEPKLQDSKVANDIKNEYADFLNGSITDPAEFKKQFRKLSLKAHPDKTGGDATLFQEISNVRDCVNSGDQRKINEAYAKLNQVVNEKSSNLSKYEKEMGSLKAQANANSGAKVNEQAKAQEAPKSDSAEKAQAKAKADNNAKAEQQGPTISTEDKIAMGQMGNQIHSAKNLSDLDKLQAQLDKIPDCAQKRNLQKQINAKKFDVADAPFAKVSEFKAGDKLPEGKKIAINGNEKFQVGKSELDLSSPEIQNRLKQMKDGEVLTIGREGDIKVGTNDSTVSRKHLAIQKDGDGFVIKDTSMNGTYIKGTEKANAKATTGVSDEIKNTFSPETQAKLSTLQEGQSVTLTKGGKRYVVTNHNGQIVIGATETINTGAKAGQAKAKSSQSLSDDIKSTFSENTQQNLSKLKNGQSVTLTKGDKHYVVKNNNGQIVIETSLDANELVRVKGNNGKEINANYVKTSVEAREYLQDAIASGQYTDSFESYVQTMNNMHRVSAMGKSGKNEWYSQAGSGGNSVNPGEIRGSGYMVNHRTNTAIEAEEIAKQYGDSYRVTKGESRVKLDGIPKEYQPKDTYDKHAVEDWAKHSHYYPDGASMGYYYKEMHRTSKETLDLINKGASEQEILAKVAEHYQYAANARPYGQINNSLFMNEINTLLQKAGLKTMPHGNLDQISMHLQPETFQKYFIDQYYQTAL